MRKEGAYGEALGRNSRGRGNHGSNAGGRSLSPAGRYEVGRSRRIGGSCPDGSRSANVRTMATSAVRVGVGLAILLVVEMVHQLLRRTRRSVVRRLGWLGVGLMDKGLVH